MPSVEKFYRSHLTPNSILILLHRLLLTLVAVLLILPYVNKSIVLSIYELSGPATTIATRILFIAELYGRETPDKQFLIAYCTLLSLLFLTMFANYFIAIRRKITVSSQIAGNVQDTWFSYMCREFYSHVRPTISPHCLFSKYTNRGKIQQVNIEKGMSHRDIIRRFMMESGQSVKEGYFIACLVWVLLIAMYWGDKSPERYWAIPHYTVVAMFVYFQLYLITEILLIVLAYFFSKHELKGG